MPPVKPSAKAGKGSSKSTRSSKSPLPSKVSKKSKVVPSKKDEIRTKRSSSSMLSTPTRRTKKQYSAEELGVPTLNGIVPSGIQKVKGAKKGKVFVDDQEQMMMILKMVDAEKTKDVESKLMRARQLEEIREARRKEMEEKQSRKKERLEETKDALRKKRKRKAKSEGGLDVVAVQVEAEKIMTNGAAGKSKKKRVSFG